MVGKEVPDPGQPLVTIVCLSYNHAPFLKESLSSVFFQTYRNIQVIIVDNGSTDGSKRIIEAFLDEEKEVIFLSNETNKGNCAAFNQALALARGKYIIDFSTDDVMFPERVEEQVTFFEDLPSHYGIIFSDAVMIRKNGNETGTHYRRKNGDLVEVVPSGNVYKNVIKKYYINTPTMMMKVSVLKELGGYDSKLAYEDFDLWVRCSRSWYFGYQNKVLTKRRVSGSGLSSAFFTKNYSMAETTYRVCQKAAWLNKSLPENIALQTRINYEMRQCLFWNNISTCRKYFELLKDLGMISWSSKTTLFFSWLPLPYTFFYKIYLVLFKKGGRK